MDSSWEAEFSSSRHVHNRGSRKSKSQTANISHIFGVYEVQCAKAENIALEQPSHTMKKKPKRQSGSTLTIQSFTDDEHGLVGTLHLPGVLDAEVYMAGSRKKLQEILNAKDDSDEDDFGSGRDLDMEHDNHEDEAEREASRSNTDPRQSSDAASERHSDEISTQEDRERSRFTKFEKNTFRQPKFWFFWEGVVLASLDSAAPSSTNNMPDSLPDKPQSGMGYIVFNGNGYKKFNGTINCETLGWTNIAISGRKE